MLFSMNRVLNVCFTNTGLKLCANPLAQNIFRLTLVNITVVSFDRYCCFINDYSSTGQVMEDAFWPHSNTCFIWSLFFYWLCHSVSATCGFQRSVKTHPFCRDIHKEWHTVHTEKQKIRHSMYRSMCITTVSRILILGKASDKFATLALLVWVVFYFCFCSTWLPAGFQTNPSQTRDKCS